MAPAARRRMALRRARPLGPIANRAVNGYFCRKCRTGDSSARTAGLFWGLRRAHQLHTLTAKGTLEQGRRAHTALAGGRRTSIEGENHEPE
jgi:hypothetical protein